MYHNEIIFQIVILLLFWHDFDPCQISTALNTNYYYTNSLCTKTADERPDRWTDGITIYCGTLKIVEPYEERKADDYSPSVQL